MKKIKLEDIIEYLEQLYYFLKEHQVDYLENLKLNIYDEDIEEVNNYITFLKNIYNYTTVEDLPVPKDFEHIFTDGQKKIMETYEKTYGTGIYMLSEEQNKETGYILVHFLLSNETLLLNYNDYHFYSDFEEDTKLPITIAENNKNKFYIKETPTQVLELIRKDKR